MTRTITKEEFRRIVLAEQKKRVDQRKRLFYDVEDYMVKRGRFKK